MDSSDRIRELSLRIPQQHVHQERSRSARGHHQEGTAGVRQLDDNNRKPICRLHFNTAQKYVGLFDEAKNEHREAIEEAPDIYRFAQRLKETAARYEG